VVKIDKKIIKIAGKISIENLAHFRCGKCDKWWTIASPEGGSSSGGDWPEKRKEWFCPWCGAKQRAQISNNR